MAVLESVHPDLFRDLMAAVCAPVTIVTTVDGDTPCGTTVSSFASLSLDPPLVTVAFDRRSGVLANILAAGRFGVNLLGHDQGDLAMLFAQQGIDRFVETNWAFDRGLPRIAGASGWIVCDLHGVVEGGDHQLLIGRVVDARRTEVPPLVYVERTFGTHSRYLGDLQP